MVARMKRTRQCARFFVPANDTLQAQEVFYAQLPALLQADHGANATVESALPWVKRCYIANEGMGTVMLEAAYLKRTEKQQFKNWRSFALEARGDRPAAFRKMPWPPQYAAPDPVLEPQLRKRSLKFWNSGDGLYMRADTPFWAGIPHNATVHAYVAAYSVKDLQERVGGYSRGGAAPSTGRVRTHWNAGAWGRKMDGITPERGLWLEHDGVVVKVA